VQGARALESGMHGTPARRSGAPAARRAPVAAIAVRPQSGVGDPCPSDPSGNTIARAR
jgi:hypothetical protein